MNPRDFRNPARPEHSVEIMRLENVCKDYWMGDGRFSAICGVNVSIYNNEIIGIIGPSGSGKSTMLHIIGLLDRPTKGKVYIDGMDTSGMNDRQQSRLRGSKIGFVFQTFNLINSLTAAENVEMPLMISDVPAGVRRRRAIETLKKVELGHRLSHYPGQMSGGERQRVAIARALVHEPEIILADEPTGNLDSRTGAEVLRIFRALHEEGRTVVIITHDPGVAAITERTFHIRDGKVYSEVQKAGAQDAAAQRKGAQTDKTEVQKK